MFGGYENERGGASGVWGPLTPETLAGEFQRRANYAAVYEKPIFIGEWGFNWKREDLAGWMRSTLANMRKVRPEYKLGENVLVEKKLTPGKKEVKLEPYEGDAVVEKGADYWLSADFLNKTDKDATLAVMKPGKREKLADGKYETVRWDIISQIPMPRGDYWNVANPLSAGFLNINAGDNENLKVAVHLPGEGEFEVKNVVLRKFEKAGPEDVADGVFGGIAFWTWGPVGQGVLPNNEVFTGELKRYFERYEKE